MTRSVRQGQALQKMAEQLLGSAKEEAGLFYFLFEFLFLNSYSL